jgi:predicted ferric reductase
LETRTAIIWFGAAAAIIAFVGFSIMIRDSELIWLQTRAMGLLAYAFLFASITIGEWRMITKNKEEFGLFRYHPGISAASIVIVLAHFISAVADNYKWGRLLKLSQYLGLSFTDKWLTFLSLGVISFYAMALVGATSYPRGIRLVKYKGWKLIHFLSYAAFFMAYIHAVNLGTDIKTSSLRTVLHPMIVFSFILVSALLFTRVLTAFRALSDMTEAVLAAAFFILLLSMVALLASSTVRNLEEIDSLRMQLAQANDSLNAQQMQYEELIGRNEALGKAIAGVRNG